ncbi:MAG: proline dehydrogenase family protein [Phycisphaerales bacterium]|nr:proline dehydrogenase family protein [Phycisphaerales bacterium]
MAIFRRKRPARGEADAISDPNVGVDREFHDAATEARILALGSELLEESRSNRGGMLSSAFWSDKLMNWSMKDEGFKTQLFRFIDTFPTLKTPAQVHEHLVDYLGQPGVTLPPGMGMGLKAGGLLKGTLSKTISSQIESMASRFIAGTDAESALPQIRKLWDQKMAFSVDLLGEACVSDAEATAYQARYMDLVERLPGEVATWPDNPVLDRDHLGPIPRTNVSIKISSLHARTDPIDLAGSLDGLVASLEPILVAAKANNVLVNFDMEHKALKDLTLELFMRCCDQFDFTAGLAMQAYLRSGDEDAKRIIDWASATGRQVTVRLVKGAYWDEETIHAEMEGWPIPVWSRKSDTDACFERMAAQFLRQVPRSTDQGGVKLALGSHNLRSIACTLAIAEQEDLPPEAVEFQMLHGMADAMKVVMTERGHRLREYVPVGEMIPGMAYLVRRLLENTSNESWLRGSHDEDMAPEDLLATPHLQFPQDPGVERIAGSPERHELSVAEDTVADGRPFFSEPLRDFAEASQRDAFGKAIAQSSVPRVANDGTVADADKALAQASKAFPAWRDEDPARRAQVLLDAADIMRSRRDELSGVVIRESGKIWREADADVCEAIDFCEYYAREALGLFRPRRLGQFVGEHDSQFHQPRGVAAVISPWNFPLAISCGMTTAALVTGNTVILKPAEQTPAIAKILVDILHKAGVPRQALHFLPGAGEVVGAHLVRDTRTAMIAFTGSKAVGLDIIEASGGTPASQPWVKRVVCEMGGKNAIIIDASADLDEAVLAVRQSAFGFQGQKCSACSRVIVVKSAAETFANRLIESIRTLNIGDPMMPSTDIGPVIDQEAADKIRSYIEIGRTEGTLAVGLPVPEGLEALVGKPYVGPHLFTGIRPDHRLATEEIFGPVLAMIEVEDLDEAFAVANATEYKLTGGLFSRMPSNIERARHEYRVGNLYINRTCTGALVGRQPFGGFGMSGIGEKAGGDAYLQQFVVPRVVCENTMRRGFAPGLE